MKKLWENWKKLAKKIGDFQARLILTVLYFVIVGPFALVIRWGADPLSIKSRAAQGWRTRAEPEDSPRDRALNQF